MGLNVTHSQSAAATTASMAYSAALAAASTSAGITTSSGRGPPLGQINQASLEGYMTDTSSVGLGGHQPLITISQPNGIRKGTYHTQQIYWMLKQQFLVVFSPLALPLLTCTSSVI